MNILSSLHGLWSSQSTSSSGPNITYNPMPNYLFRLISDNSNTGSDPTGQTINTLPQENFVASGSKMSYSIASGSKIKTLSQKNIFTSTTATATGTVATFFYPHQFTSSWETILCYYPVNNASLRILIQRSNTGTFYFFFGDQNATFSSTALAANQWSHVAITWKATSNTAGTANCYVNGSLVATVSPTNWASFDSTSIADPDRLWQIGAEYTSSAVNKYSVFHFAIWEGVDLQAAQILAIANAGLA